MPLAVAMGRKAAQSRTNRVRGLVDEATGAARRHPLAVFALGLGVGVLAGRVSTHLRQGSSGVTRTADEESVGPSAGNRHADHPGEENVVGISDKVQEMTGKAKEAVGGAVGNEELQAEGRADQRSAHAQQAGDELAEAQQDASQGLRAAKDDIVEAGHDAKERISKATDHAKQAGTS